MEQEYARAAQLFVFSLFFVSFLFAQSFHFSFLLEVRLRNRRKHCKVVSVAFLGRKHRKYGVF